MNAGRQLIRFSLPGGLFAILLVFHRVVFHIAWDTDRPSDGLELIARNALLVTAAVVLIGFLLYQIYYSLHRPVLVFRFRGRVLLGPYCAHDRGGAVLRGLEDLPGAFERLRVAHRLDDAIGFLPVPSRRSVDGRPVDEQTLALMLERYRKRWYRNAHVVRSLLNTIATSGYEEVKRDYVVLTDIYHALGACRVAVVAALTGIVAYLVPVYSERFIDHPAQSGLALVICAAVSAAMWWVCDRNRRDTWHTMTSQLRSDLRQWYLANERKLAVPKG